MAKLDIRGLNYITSSKKQSTFNLDFVYTDDGHILGSDSKKPSDLSVVKTRTFFADIGSEESLATSYDTNRASLYDISNDMIIHNLYDLTKTKIKSSIRMSNGDSKETVDLFAPYVSDDFIEMCQFETYAYCLTKRMDQSPVILSVQFNNLVDTDYSYHYLYDNGIIDTHLYRPLSSVYDSQTIGTIGWLVDNSPTPEDLKPQISTYQSFILSCYPLELSVSRLSTIFDPIRKLQGIRYNYLIEIPESKNYNDYYSGSIYGDTFICKNDLAWDYSMNIPGDYHTLTGCRDYAGLGTCGGKMFLKYRDNVSFTHRDAIHPCYHTDPNNEYLTRPMEENERGDYSYQHVEVIESLNRYDSNSVGHKSSLYSLRLYDTGLNNTKISEGVKEKLRQNIVNNIRTIAEKICPANTQLFNVYFEGK